MQRGGLEREEGVWGGRKGFGEGGRGLEREEGVWRGRKGFGEGGGGLERERMEVKKGGEVWRVRRGK